MARYDSYSLKNWPKGGPIQVVTIQGIDIVPVMSARFDRVEVSELRSQSGGALEHVKRDADSARTDRRTSNQDLLRKLKTLSA